VPFVPYQSANTEWNYLIVIHSIPANYESFEESKRYDIILANPPLKGAIDRGDVNDTSCPLHKCPFSRGFWPSLRLEQISCSGKEAVRRSMSFILNCF
jgi:hypothetical protein